MLGFLSREGMRLLWSRRKLVCPPPPDQKERVSGKIGQSRRFPEHIGQRVTVPAYHLEMTKFQTIPCPLPSPHWSWENPFLENTIADQEIFSQAGRQSVTLGQLFMISCTGMAMKYWVLSNSSEQPQGRWHGFQAEDLIPLPKKCHRLLSDVFFPSYLGHRYESVLLEGLSLMLPWTEM